MPLQVMRENEGKLVPVKINQIPSGTNSVNIKSIKHQKKKRVAPHSAQKFKAKKTYIPESDSESDIESDDSDEFDNMHDDPTIQALSNPNKTIPPAQRGGSINNSDDDGSISYADSFTKINSGSDNESDISAQQETFKKSKKSYSESDSDPGISNKETDRLKAELLSKFDRLSKKGVKVSKKFTMKSKLKDMQKEFERLNRNIEVDSAIKFQRKALIAILSGLEFVNKKFDPFSVKLEGWTESITNDIDEYDNVFERLYDKYHGTAEMAPEIELMMMLAGSALMFHMSKSLFNNNFNFNSILKQNPDLMANLMKSMQSNASSGVGITPPAVPGTTNAGGSPTPGAGNSTNNMHGSRKAEIIDDISDRLSENSFDSDMTGVKSVNIRMANETKSSSKNGKRPRKVMDINL